MFIGRSKIIKYNKMHFTVMLERYSKSAYTIKYESVVILMNLFLICLQTSLLSDLMRSFTIYALLKQLVQQQQ